MVQEQFNTLIDGLHQRENALYEHPVMQVAYFLHRKHCDRNKRGFGADECSMEGHEKIWVEAAKETLTFIGSVIPSETKAATASKRKLKMEK